MRSARRPDLEFGLELHAPWRPFLLTRRIPDQDTLRHEVAALEAERNRTPSAINWRFTTADARIKLKKLYPVIQP